MEKVLECEGFVHAIPLNEGEIRSHLDQWVRTSLEETLNGHLHAEANRLYQANRCERSASRVDARADHYKRKLDTK